MMNAGAMPVDNDRWMWLGCLNHAAIERYVLGRRTPEGGYCFYRTPQWAVEEPNAPDTLAALESLMLLDVDIPAPSQTAGWLRSLQDPCGGYPTLTIGWAALRALDALAVEPTRDPDRWLRGLLETFCDCDGPRDWRAAIVDAVHLCELMRLRHKVLRGAERDNIGTLLGEARTPDGGWASPGADLETTGMGVQLAQLVSPQWQPDPPLSAFLGRCEDELLGLRLAPDAGTTAVGALWGGLTLGRALHSCPRYLGAIEQQLVLLQRPDGGLGARHRAISGLQATWLGLRAAALIDGLREE
jgi:prenyltransferase/squalene oxidase-like repeat protein